MGETFAGFAAAQPAIASRVAALRRAPQWRSRPSRPVLLHDDLLPEHLLVSEAARRLTGVIDWGDVTIGPAARDFVGAYFWRGRAFTERVLGHYHGEAGPADLDWMRVRVVSIGLSHAEYGRLAGRPEYVRSGLHGIEQALRA